jgi:hypothetical protein
LNYVIFNQIIGRPYFELARIPRRSANHVSVDGRLIAVKDNALSANAMRSEDFIPAYDRAVAVVCNSGAIAALLRDDV